VVVVIGIVVAVAAIGTGFLLVVDADHVLHFVVALGVIAAVLTVGDAIVNATSSGSSNANSTSIPTFPTANPDPVKVRPEHGDDFWPSILKIWGPALGGWLDIAIFGGLGVGLAAGAVAKVLEPTR
jgi:hypothetical protein